MAEYTPSTEQVRRYWQYGVNAWMAGVADDRDDGPDGSIGAEFDRWLKAHDAKVAAATLREAADDVGRHGSGDIRLWARDADTWLLERAERIEATS